MVPPTCQNPSAARCRHVVIGGARATAASAAGPVVGDREGDRERLDRGLDRGRARTSRHSRRDQGSARTRSAGEGLPSAADPKVIVRVGEPVDRHGAAGRLHRRPDEVCCSPTARHSDDDLESGHRGGRPAVVVGDRDRDGVAARVPVDVGRDEASPTRPLGADRDGRPPRRRPTAASATWVSRMPASVKLVVTSAMPPA